METFSAGHNDRRAALPSTEDELLMAAFLSSQDDLTLPGGLVSFLESKTLEAEAGNAKPADFSSLVDNMRPPSLQHDQGCVHYQSVLSPTLSGPISTETISTDLPCTLPPPQPQPVITTCLSANTHRMHQTRSDSTHLKVRKPISEITLPPLLEDPQKVSTFVSAKVRPRASGRAHTLSLHHGVQDIPRFPHYPDSRASNTEPPNKECQLISTSRPLVYTKGALQDGRMNSLNQNALRNNFQQKERGPRHANRSNTSAPVEFAPSSKNYVNDKFATQQQIRLASAVKSLEISDEWLFKNPFSSASICTIGNLKAPTRRQFSVNHESMSKPQEPHHHNHHHHHAFQNKAMGMDPSTMTPSSRRFCRNRKKSKSTKALSSAVLNPIRKCAPVDLIICLPVVIAHGTIHVTKTSGKNFYDFANENDPALLYFSSSSGVSDTWASLLQIKLGRICRVPVQQLHDVVAVFQAAFKDPLTIFVASNFGFRANTNNNNNNNNNTTSPSSYSSDAVAWPMSGDEKKVMNSSHDIVNRSWQRVKALLTTLLHSSDVPLTFEDAIRFKCCGIQYVEGPANVEASGRRRYETRALFETDTDAQNFESLCARLYVLDQYLSCLSEKCGQVQKGQKNEPLPLQCVFIPEVYDTALARARGLPIVIREYGVIQSPEVLETLQTADLSNERLVARGIETSEIRLEHTSKKMVDPRFIPNMILTRLVAGNEHPRDSAEMICVIENAQRLKAAKAQQHRSGEGSKEWPLRFSSLGMGSSGFGRYVFSKNKTVPSVLVEYEDADDCYLCKHGFIYTWYAFQRAASQYVR